MAKTAPIKRKGQSIHSRAAKRASSPSIDTDKSLKNIKPPAESSNFRPSILSIHHGAGVTKKSKGGRKSVLSSKAKRRQEKGLDRAEAVMDKKEKKVERSRGKAKTVQGRSKAWDELNRKLLSKKAHEEALALEKESRSQQEVEEDEEDEEDERAYGEMDEVVMDGVKDLEISDIPAVESGTPTVHGIDVGVEEDEIL